MTEQPEDVPILTDGNLLLDSYTFEDVPAQVAGEDEETARWFGWYPHRSDEHTVRRAIERSREEWRTAGSRLAWAVRDAATRELLGNVEIRLKEDGIAHISWAVLQQHRGRGVAAAAARMVCRYAFERLGVARFEAYVEPENVASRRTAERAGFIEEGVLRQQAGRRGSRHDMVLYSRLPTDP